MGVEMDRINSRNYLFQRPLLWDNYIKLHLKIKLEVAFSIPVVQENTLEEICYKIFAYSYSKKWSMQCTLKVNAITMWTLCSLLFFLLTDFAAALCDPIAYHQEADKRQEQLKSLLDEEDLEDVSF